MIELFGETAPIQIWVYFWIMIGVFANYLRIKRLNKNKITLTGVVKKVIIGIISWGLFLTAYQGIENMGQIQVIIPALLWGLSSEVIVGGWLQQKIEQKVVKNRS